MGQRIDNARSLKLPATFTVSRSPGPISKAHHGGECKNNFTYEATGDMRGFCHPYLILCPFCRSLIIEIPKMYILHSILSEFKLESLDNEKK
jgi:hypothetical protein